jgi:CRP/FNR family transcriptional regulator
MLIVEGSVKLYQEDEDGGEYFMYHLNPGEACAVTLVCNYHHEKSQVLAKAVTDISYLSIPVEFMDKWLNEFKSWHYFVIKTYRSRYEELLKTIHEIAFKNMDERLEFYIKRQVSQFGASVNLTHQEIANDLNTSREVVSRLLKKMEHNGWIKMNRNSFDWVKK